MPVSLCQRGYMARLSETDRQLSNQQQQKYLEVARCDFFFCSCKVTQVCELTSALCQESDGTPDYRLPRRFYIYCIF